MRKFIILLVIVSLSIACSPTNDLPDIPITESMKIVESETQEFAEENTLSTVYLVEGADQNTFLNDYEKFLNDAGWTTVERRDPGFLTVEKDNYEIFVIALENANKVSVNTILRPKEAK